MRCVFVSLCPNDCLDAVQAARAQSVATVVQMEPEYDECEQA